MNTNHTNSITPISLADENQSSKDANASRSAGEVIASSNLPAAITDCIALTVRATQLWRRERADVARELVAHFNDGIERGEPAHALIASFGSPKAAGKRIGKAARAKRSWFWHARVRVYQGVGVLVGLFALTYGVQAIRFAAGSPTISRNFTAELNKPILAIPNDQRAWPIYLNAWAELQPTATDIDALDTMVTATPGTPEFEAARAWLDRAQPQLDRVRAAAKLPALGYVLGLAPEPVLSQTYNPSTVPVPVAEINAKSSAQTPPANLVKENPTLYEISLEPLGPMRRLALYVKMDTLVAADARDGERVVQNVRTLLGMARQVDKMPFMLSDLIAMAIASVAWESTIEIIASYPGVLNDAQLAVIAQEFAKDSGPNEIRAHLGNETDYFEDTLQRMFTDDGNGDGRLTPAGLRFLQQLSSSPPFERVMDSSATLHALGPAIMTVAPGRKATLVEWKKAFAAAEEYEQTPIWEWETNPDTSFTAHMHQSNLSNPVIVTLMPAFGSVIVKSDRTQQTREAAMVVVAIERYRLANRVWPATLDALVPMYLATVPLDRCDGNPLRYRFTPQGPIVYSIGWDRIDDQGRSVYDTNGKPITQQAWVDKARAQSYMNDKHVRETFAGDIVFFPKLQPKPQPQPQPQAKPEPKADFIPESAPESK